MNEKEMIEFWKANTQAFMFAPKEAQEWLLNSYAMVDLLVEVTPEKAEWHDNGHPCSGNPAVIYRIQPDYQSKPVGRWVECEVYPSGNSFAYYFKHKGECTPLYEATGMVGFGGVEYEGWGWEDVLAAITKDGKLCRPIKVKFWVEG